jgi:hypothetical protein
MSATPQSADTVLEAARKASAAYIQSLPDYIVKRTTTRFVGAHPLLSTIEAAGGWRALDTVSGELTVRHGAEFYSNLTVDGKPVGSAPGGAWSTGEFSNEMSMVLPPERAARFTNLRVDSVRNRAAYRYSFAVDKSHSSWDLTASNIPGASDVTGFSSAYTGTVWIDRDTGQTLRVQTATKDLPAGFSLEAVTAVTDFDFVKIGDTQYVLPVSSETVSCQRTTGVCLKNATVFKSYDRFDTSTSITFNEEK